MGKTFKTTKDIHIFNAFNNESKILPKGSLVSKAETVKGCSTQLDDGSILCRLPKGYKGHNASRYKTYDYQWLEINNLKEITNNAHI